MNSGSIIILPILAAAIIGGCETTTSVTCLSEKEIAELSIRADRGDIAAAERIETHYESCAPDPVKARKWLEKRALFGDARAYYRLYALDEYSSEISIRTEAFLNLMKSAEGGDNFAQRILADKYFRGDGIKKNFKKGEAWLNRAARSGDPSAMREKSILILVKGRSKNDIREAYMWARLSQRSVAETSVYGRLAMRQAETIKLTAKRHGIPQADLEAAVKDLPAQKNPKRPMEKSELNALIQSAQAGAGLGTSQAEMADLYFSGYGVKQSTEQGLKLLRQMAGSCEASAMIDLPPLLLASSNDVKSFAEAAAWSKLVIRSAPLSAYADDARRYLEFIKIGAQSSGISEESIQEESTYFMKNLDCIKR